MSYNITSYTESPKKIGASLENLLKLTKTLGVEIKDLLPDEEK